MQSSLSPSLQSNTDTERGIDARLVAALAAARAAETAYVADPTAANRDAYIRANAALKPLRQPMKSLGVFFKRGK